MLGAQARGARTVTSQMVLAASENYIEDLVVRPDDVKSALWLFALGRRNDTRSGDWLWMLLPATLSTSPGKIRVGNSGLPSDL